MSLCVAFICPMSHFSQNICRLAPKPPMVNTVYLHRTLGIELSAVKFVSVFNVSSELA